MYFTLLVHEMGQCLCHCTSVHCLFGYHSYSNYSGHLYQICRYAFGPSFGERIELCHFGRTFALLPKHFLPIGQTWYHCLWSSKVSIPTTVLNFIWIFLSVRFNVKSANLHFFLHLFVCTISNFWYSLSLSIHYIVSDTFGRNNLERRFQWDMGAGDLLVH